MRTILALGISFILTTTAASAQPVSDDDLLKAAAVCAAKELPQHVGMPRKWRPGFQYCAYLTSKSDPVLVRRGEAQISDADAKAAAEGKALIDKLGK